MLPDNREELKAYRLEMTADPFYSKNNMEYLERIVASINDGTAKLEEHDLIEAD